MINSTSNTARLIRTGAAFALLTGMLALGAGGSFAGALTETLTRTPTGTRATQSITNATREATVEATQAATQDQTATQDSTQTAGTCLPLPVSTTTPVPAGTLVTRTPIPTRTAPGYLGVAGGNSEDGCGVLIARIEADSPAFAAGLLPDDVIIGITVGEVTVETRDLNILRDALVRAGEGGVVTLYVARGGQVVTVEATLSARPQINLTPTVSS